MTTNSPVMHRVSQSVEPGALLSLFELDLRPAGAQEVWHFTNSQKQDGTPIRFRGVDYVAVNVEVEGYEYNGQGQLPQPKIKLANATKFASGAAIAYQDLVGAKLTRVRTYAQFLDDGETPDPDAAYDADIYVIEQKLNHDKFFIEWSMSAAMDQQGRMLPGRTVLRETCSWRYRVWDASIGNWRYDRVTCPYQGGAMFDHRGNPTSEPSKDQCGKRLSDCMRRFGEGAVLPYGGFPGVSRARV